MGIPRQVKTVLDGYRGDLTTPWRAKLNDSLILATVGMWPHKPREGARRRSQELAVLTDIHGVVS